MIDVDCICGRRYQLPDEKAGRKLQCRRCGAVQRVPRAASDDEAPVVPFRIVDSGERDLDVPRPIAPPLDLRDPLKRCPSCGFQDDPGVVLCVRCGYDWRSGTRLRDAHEAAADSARVRAQGASRVDADQLQLLARLCLTPLALLLGPYVLGRALLRPAGGRGRRGPGPEVPALAAGGLVVWGALLVLAVLRVGGGDSGLDIESRSRLERVGRAIRDQVELEGRYPPPGVEMEPALEALIAANRLTRRDLSSPYLGDLYPYRRRQAELLTRETQPGYLLLWELEPHPDALGRIVYRALRFDGSIEVFAQRAELEAATRRPPFLVAGEQGLAAAVDPPPGAGQGTAAGAGTPPGASEWQRQEGRFLAFAGEFDDLDPDLSRGVRVQPDLFTTRVGIPPDQLIPVLLRQERPQLREAAARLLARLELPRAFRLPLASELARDRAPGVRLAAAVCLRQLEEPAWLRVLGGLAEEASGEASARALRLLGEEAARSREGARAVLGLALEVRARIGARGDDAIFALPEAALPNVIELLVNPDVAPEAAAVLYTADEVGLPHLRQALGSPERLVRLRALRVLERLEQKGVIGLGDYLAAVSAELDQTVRAEAVRALAERLPRPTALLVAWALETLRVTGQRAELRAVCGEILNRVGREGAPAEREVELGWLVADLEVDGDHRAVIDELEAPYRLLDERLDALLGAAWPRLREPRVRVELARLLGKRPLESALTGLLPALSDPDEEVRREALLALAASGAPRSEELRRDISQRLTQRLRDEESPRAQEALLQLCSGGMYRSQSLISALQRLARRGDAAAVRTLGTHPDERQLAFVIQVLDASRDPVVQGACLAVLRQLTGIAMNSTDAAMWQQYVSPLPPQVAQQLRTLQERDERQVNDQLERARRRLEKLQREQGR